MLAVVAILAVLLALASAVAVVAVRALVRSLQDDRLFLRARVCDLERQLASHSWQDYAQISTVPSPALVTPDNLPRNGWGEARAEEAYGESADDVIESFLASNGVDLEGPTVG